jgi:hypothetical protein
MNPQTSGSWSEEARQDGERAKKGRWHLTNRFAYTQHGSCGRILKLFRTVDPPSSANSPHFKCLTSPAFVKGARRETWSWNLSGPLKSKIRLLERGMPANKRARKPCGVFEPLLVPMTVTTRPTESILAPHPTGKITCHYGARSARQGSLPFHETVNVYRRE